MTLIGYTMMCEQAGPKQLVRDVAHAEDSGFDFAVISDHYFPWLESQGHAPHAKDQFRWFTAGWRVNAELPLPASFDVASKKVRDEDVAAQMPCGSDLQRYLAGIREFEAAGFTHLALVQVGADKQEEFISWAASELLPALRSS
jgi:hypothetical protein